MLRETLRLATSVESLVALLLDQEIDRIGWGRKDPRILFGKKLGQKTKILPSGKLCRKFYTHLDWPEIPLLRI
jgi:hypothetical protein